MYMKKIILIAVYLFGILSGKAQDAQTLLMEARNFEKQFRETEALARYEQLFAMQPSSITYLVKMVEYQLSLGSKQKGEDRKKSYYELALSNARKAIALNADDADALYSIAAASGKMTELDLDPKQTVAFVKDVHSYSSKALSVRPGHARALYTLGRWHLEVSDLNWAKKAAVRTLFGSLPKSSLTEAIRLLEESRKADMYFTNTYLDLATAYELDNKVVKVQENLRLLARMPVRNANDAAVKAAGARMMAKYQ